MVKVFDLQHQKKKVLVSGCCSRLSLFFGQVFSQSQSKNSFASAVKKLTLFYFTSAGHHSALLLY